MLVVPTKGSRGCFWGLGGWLSKPDRPTTLEWRGRQYDLLALTRRALLNGTDPASPGYWGVPESSAPEYEQRTVESGQVAFAIWQTRSRIWDNLSATEQQQLLAWLVATGRRPAAWRNNWALFWALNHRVRDMLGGEFEAGLVDDVLAYLDRVYVGGGWYDDGPERGTNHFDDYNLWVFASHVLACSQMEEGDSPRQTKLLNRVRDQMVHVPWIYAADGAYPEYGRSLSYKFARLGAPLWAYRAGAWPHPVGLLRRLVGRHLRWYIDRGALRADGTLRQELTSQGSPEIRETYISTGATYWAMQAFGGLWSLPDDDPFWTTDEESLPVERRDFIHVMPEPGFVLVGTQATGAIQRFSARSHHGMPTKYGKFHYTTAAPFNVGLAQGTPLPDAMLTLTDGRQSSHRDEIEAAAVGDLGWLRFRYPIYLRPLGLPGHFGKFTVETVIVPLDEAHVRVHRITSEVPFLDPIQVFEGGAALGFPPGTQPQIATSKHGSLVTAGGVTSAIVGLRGGPFGQRALTFGEIGANSVHGCQLVPYINYEEPVQRPWIYASIVHIGAPLDDLEALEKRVVAARWGRDDRVTVTLRGGRMVEVPPLPKE